MKKIIALLSVLLILAGQFDASGRGYYNPVLRLIVCHDHNQCLHEIGHAVDHKLGWISGKKEFQESLFYFTYIDHALRLAGNHEWTGKILFYPGIFSPRLKESNPFMWSWREGWGGMRELYADMLVWSDGDKKSMPVEFTRFYDWETVDALIEQYIER